MDHRQQLPGLGWSFAPSHIRGFGPFKPIGALFHPLMARSVSPPTIDRLLVMVGGPTNSHSMEDCEISPRLDSREAVEHLSDRSTGLATERNNGRPEVEVFLPRGNNEP